MIEQEMLNRTSYFTREQDIQIALAHRLESSCAFDRVFVEQHIPAGMIPNYPWTDANNIYIDLVIQKDGFYYPLEIKFKTKSQPIPLSVLGNDELITRGHPARSHFNQAPKASQSGTEHLKSPRKMQ